MPFCSPPRRAEPLGPTNTRDHHPPATKPGPKRMPTGGMTTPASTETYIRADKGKIALQYFPARANEARAFAIHQFPKPSVQPPPTRSTLMGVVSFHPTRRSAGEPSNGAPPRSFKYRLAAGQRASAARPRSTPTTRLQGRLTAPMQAADFSSSSLGGGLCSQSC